MLHSAVRRNGLGWRASLPAIGGTRAAELPLATAPPGGEGGGGGGGGRAGRLSV